MSAARLLVLTTGRSLASKQGHFNRTVRQWLQGTMKAIQNDCVNKGCRVSLENGRKFGCKLSHTKYTLLQIIITAVTVLPLFPLLPSESEGLSCSRLILLSASPSYWIQHDSIALCVSNGSLIGRRLKYRSRRNDACRAWS